MSSIASPRPRLHPRSPLQLLLLAEARVERELLVVAHAPELGVRVLRVAALESGGLLEVSSFGFDRSRGFSSERKKGFRRSSCFSVLVGPTSAQRDPVRLSGGCMHEKSGGSGSGGREREGRAKQKRVNRLLATEFSVSSKKKIKTFPLQNQRRTKTEETQSPRPSTLSLAALGAPALDLLCICLSRPSTPALEEEPFLLPPPPTPPPTPPTSVASDLGLTT